MQDKILALALTRDLGAQFGHGVVAHGRAVGEQCDQVDNHAMLQGNADQLIIKLQRNFFRSFLVLYLDLLALLVRIFGFGLRLALTLSLSLTCTLGFSRTFFPRTFLFFVWQARRIFDLQTVVDSAASSTTRPQLIT